MSRPMTQGLVLIRPRSSRVALDVGAIADRRASLLLGGATAVALAVLAAANGGYYAPAWGWSSLIAAAVAAVALVWGVRVPPSVLEIAFLVLLTSLLGWIAVSVAWSENVPRTALEIERGLIYAAGALAVLALSWRGRVRPLLAGLLVAATVVSAYGLATRLFPERLGSFDSIASYRLSEPIGYWNALGIFAALGALLALGFVARARGLAGRALAAASLVVLLPTLYFTYSRGAWIALAIGLLASIALDPRRLRLVTAMLAIAPWPAVAVWLASQSSGLTNIRSPLATASRDGHRLAFVVLLLALGAAGTAAALGLIARRVNVPPSARIAYAAALVVVVVAGLTTVFVRYGGPSTLAQRAYDSFTAPPPKITGDLNARLFNFSSRGRYQQWKNAWQMYEERPWLGHGAGTYEQYWHQHRPVPGKVRDAHSLYLETLAELGPVGLALLLLAFGVPLVAAVKARRHALVPVAFGAYVAYIVHAGVDWDWEMPAVTLVALFCGAAMLVAARTGRERPFGSRTRAGLLVATLALGAFAFVGLIGNSALSSSADALAASDWSKAEAEARKAARWAPWSSDPWQLLGQIELAQGDEPAARAAFQKAIAKDPHNWELWLGLAGSSDGRAQERALAEVTRLNPFTAPRSGG
jgi:tetratricopeptide (TPR) repeat protein